MGLRSDTHADERERMEWRDDHRTIHSDFPAAPDLFVLFSIVMSLPGLQVRDVWCPCVSVSRRVVCARVSCPGLIFESRIVGSGVRVRPFRDVSFARVCPVLG